MKKIEKVNILLFLLSEYLKYATAKQQQQQQQQNQDGKQQQQQQQQPNHHHRKTRDDLFFLGKSFGKTFEGVLHDRVRGTSRAFQIVQTCGS